MSVHVQAIKALTPEDYQLIQREHEQLEKFVHDLKHACVCSSLQTPPDCSHCDHEKQASCQGRLPSFLHYVMDLAASHFEHEEAIMLNRPGVSGGSEYFLAHQHAHAEIMEQLNALVYECFSLDNNSNTAQVYVRFYQQLSNIFEAHDRAFDDPFIRSTQG